MELFSYGLKKLLHPILIDLVKRQRKHHLHILNEQPKVGGNAIYAVNHSCVYDFPITCEAIGRHTYVLIGKQRLKLIDRICFHLNGIIYVDRKNKLSRKKASQVIISHLLKGQNICVYPESTWNLTSSKPMLPLYWGIIDIAREANCPIIPLVLEYRGYDCYIKWGIHRSFFEFNYVRLHYKEMCRRGMKEKKFMHSSLKSFYEECHYNRTFAPEFPQAEVILLKSGKKSLSELRPEEAGRMIQIHIMRSEDLLHPEFRKFIQGFYYFFFMLGSWKINNVQLRCLLQNKYLNLSEWKMGSDQALDWFHGLPIYALNLSHTGIRTLDFLKNFPLLERFVSVGNPLVDVKDVEQCMNLRYLNLSNCRLTSYALEIRWPESLRKLIVSNNEILNLAFVSRMRLDELDISDNPLQSGVESLMGIPGRVRCVYHFSSDALKAMILNEKQLADKEIQYDDMMSFLRDNDDTVRLKDEITSTFGLENICCKSIMLPLRLIPSLNALSRPLHTDRVVVLAEYEYKLGYVLNDLFSYLDCYNRQQMTLEYAIKLLNQCDSLLDYLIDNTVCENCDMIRCNDALEGTMDVQTFRLCLQEVLLIAGVCLKYMRRCGANLKGQDSSRKIDGLACDYMSKHFVPDYLRPENSKNLSEQHKKYSEQGKVFERAINTILSNTKGLSEIIWSIKRGSHVEMKIIESLENI